MLKLKITMVWHVRYQGSAQFDSKCSSTSFSSPWCRVTHQSARALAEFESVRNTQDREPEVTLDIERFCHVLRKIKSYSPMRFIAVSLGITFSFKSSWLFFLLPIILGWIRFKVFFVRSERSMQHSDHHRALWTWLLMMSMSFMSDTLNSPDPSKSAFLEFGHGLTSNQQHLSGFAHNIYPVHGLHSGGHLQHDGPYPSTASHYSRPLGYAYPGPVSAPAPGAYVPYQPNNHSSTLAHTRAEETSEYPHKTSKCEVLTPSLRKIAYIRLFFSPLIRLTTAFANAFCLYKCNAYLNVMLASLLD